MDTAWTGQADVPVLGPEDISPNEMAEILSDVLGKPVRYEQTPIEAYKTRMVSRGMSQAFAQGLADMMTAKNEGMDNIASRRAGAHTPTTFRQWCETVLKSALLGLSCAAQKAGTVRDCRCLEALEEPEDRAVGSNFRRHH